MMKIWSLHYMIPMLPGPRSIWTIMNGHDLDLESTKNIFAKGSQSESDRTWSRSPRNNLEKCSARTTSKFRLILHGRMDFNRDTNMNYFFGGQFWCSRAFCTYISMVKVATVTGSCACMICWFLKALLVSSSWGVQKLTCYDVVP